MSTGRGHIGADYPPDFSHTATRTNKLEFVSKWVRSFGGTVGNAYWVWSVAVANNESRDLSRPCKPTPR